MPARGCRQGEHRRRCGPRQGVKPAFLPAEYVQDAATMRGFPFLARCAAMRGLPLSSLASCEKRHLDTANRWGCRLVQPVQLVQSKNGRYRKGKIFFQWRGCGIHAEGLPGCGPCQDVKRCLPDRIQDAATMRGFPFLARCAACLVHPAEPGKLKLRRCAAMRRACLTSSKKDMKGKNIFSENGEAAMEKKDALRGGTDEK